MADGTIVIDTRLETDKLKNKLAKLNNDIERQTGKVKELKAEYDRLNSSMKTPKTDSPGQILPGIDKAEGKLKEYYAELESIKQRTDELLKNAETPNQVENVLSIEKLEVDALNAKYADKLKTKLDAAKQPSEDIAEAAEKARLKYEQAQIALEKMQNDAAVVQAEISNTGNKSGLIQQNFKAAKQQLVHFGKRLKGVVKQVLIFAAFAAVLRKVRSYIGEALSANEGFQKSLAQLKGTLRTAFQPILNFVIPILQALINILNAAMGYVARFTSWLFGTTVSASSAAAKALYDQANATEAAGAAAQKAKRQMSGLDEMNTWQSDNSGGGGGSVAPKVDFSGIKSSMGDLEVYISGALLALGAILAFTSASIPLGIALMALGAAGLASALGVDWDTMPKNVKAALTATLLVLGGAALVIGAILTFSGADLPLGIGLLVAGATALGTAAALNWDTVKSKLQGNLGKILGIVSGFLLVMGLIAICTGAGIPLGVGLMLAGAAGLATVATINWNAILDKLKSVWSGIKNWFKSNVAPKLTKKYWQEKFDTLKTALTDKIKGGINAAIALFNKFVAWVNDKMHITWNGVSIAGKQIIPSGDIQLLKLKNIPMLAQGGVIPANHAFLSILGDQKQGTNIEAPEELIRKIVREEAGAGTYTFIAQLDGKTIFKEVIEQGKLSRRMTGKNAFNLGGA